MYRTGRKSALYRTRNSGLSQKENIHKSSFFVGNSESPHRKGRFVRILKALSSVVLRLRLLSVCCSANCDVGLRVISLRFCKHLALLYLFIVSKPWNKADQTKWTCSVVCIKKNELYFVKTWRFFCAKQWNIGRKLTWNTNIWCRPIRKWIDNGKYSQGI